LSDEFVPFHLLWLQKGNRVDIVQINLKIASLVGSEPTSGIS